MLHLQMIKDLHVAFIKQVENFWNKVSTSFWNHWHRFLQTIEPTFIKFIHYLESALWKASREILGKTPVWYSI
jgi:fucose 4-O-acetylase-like acetyltransferase